MMKKFFCFDLNHLSNLLAGILVGVVVYGYVGYHIRHKCIVILFLGLITLCQINRIQITKLAGKMRTLGEREKDEGLKLKDRG